MGEDLDFDGATKEMRKILENELVTGAEPMTVWQVRVDLEKIVYRIFFSREETDHYIKDLKIQHPEIDELAWPHVIRVYKVVMEEKGKIFAQITKC